MIYGRLLGILSRTCVIIIIINSYFSIARASQNASTNIFQPLKSIDAQVVDPGCLEADNYSEVTCFIDCNNLTDTECSHLEDRVYRNLDLYIHQDFEGRSDESQDQLHQTHEDQEPEVIARYTISRALDLELIENHEPDESERFKAIWQHITELLPHSEYLSSLNEFQIASDGIGETLAFVAQDETDQAQWLIAFDSDDFTTADDPEFVHTVIHEFSHLIFLHTRQLNAQPENQCQTLFIDEGCSEEHSFLFHFYQRFWTSVIDEHRQAEQALQDGDEDSALIKFYQKETSRFVSEYAATDPIEDIAESFTYFVLTQRPTGHSIAEQKILFFYQYKNLLTIRHHIRAVLGQKTSHTSAH